jgi:co-chaperonin GroES (HSP10)
MKAIRQYILVEKIKTKPRTVAGLEVIEDKNEEIRYFKGKVVSSGSIANDEGVNDNDIIWYDRHAGHDQVFDKALLRVISVGDVVAVD